MPLEGIPEESTGIPIGAPIMAPGIIGWPVIIIGCPLIIITCPGIIIGWPGPRGLIMGCPGAIMCWPGAIIIPAPGIIIPGGIIIPCPPAGNIEPRPSGAIIMPCVLRGTMPLSIGDPDAIGN